MLNELEKDVYSPWIGTLNENILKEFVNDRISVSLIDNYNDYKTIFMYLYEKFNNYMDGKEHDLPLYIEKFKQFYNELDIEDISNYEMYGLVYYDKELDYEPIAISGSFFIDLKDFKAIPKFDFHSNKNKIGIGLLAFLDPMYRGVDLGKNQWLTEQYLYQNKFNIDFQYELHNNKSLEIIKSLFKVIEIKDDEINEEVKDHKVLLDYRVKNNYYQENFYKFDYDKVMWNFLDREDFTKEELLNLFDKYFGI